MRVLVIGGSGYLGTLVVPFLAPRHDLRVFDLQPPENGEAKSVLEYVQGSVCDPAALAGAVAGMDAVLYMAMGSAAPLGGDHWGRIESRVNAFDVNVKGLHLALHAAHLAGISQAVFTSSMSVYADNGVGHADNGVGHADNGVGRTGRDEDTPLESEDTPPDSDWIYGFTKRLGEEVCRNACRAWGMDVNALRLFLPVPEDKWLAEASQAAPTPWTTAEDTARAMLAALEYRDGFQAFTISGDYEQKLMSLAKAKRLLNWEPLARPIKPD